MAVRDQGRTSQVPQALVERLREDVVLAGGPLVDFAEVVGERIEGSDVRRGR